MTGPRVVAHRGSSVEFGEHTRAAYERALRDGADGLECDIRLSADLVPVLMHDARLDATTSAVGPLSGRTAAELDLVEVGARRRPARRRRAPSGRAQPGSDQPGSDQPGSDQPRSAQAQRAQPRPAADGDAPLVETGVLRLAEFLSIAAAAGRPVELALETKHPSRAGRHLEAAVLAALTAEPTVRAGARVMSFSTAALNRLRELDPTVPTLLLLVDSALGRGPFPLPPAADHAGPSIRQLRRDPGLVARLHDGGHEVHVWTVDSDADIDRCVDLGVDVLITNRPGHVLGRLGR